MELIFDSGNNSCFVESSEVLRQVEASLSKKSKDAECIESQSSGYMLAWVLFIQSQLWIRLCRILSIDIGGLYFSEESQHILDLISEILQLTEKLNTWIDNFEERETLFPLTLAALKGSRFWILQQVLYLIHDYRMLQSEGWVYSRSRFQSHMLPWQVGWLHTSPGSIQIIAQILNYD